eukprot:TRINITY_DN11753_c0_g1_i1.p1 TRINITY_DN11753_c0_g1~~TRINITY_DN11753_c0_g1_i1.p1  ORF type:complete len:853 (+),score=238.37 TRINITY_DN11753_c0_g1_i1:63-2621(+)
MPVITAARKSALAVEREKEKCNVAYYLGTDPPRSPDDLTFEGKTLADAAEKGGVEDVAALLIGGVDVNGYRSSRHASALHHSTRQEGKSVTQYLLERGADIEGTTGGDVTTAGQTPLMWAVSRGGRDLYAQITIPEVLVEAGANINAADHRGRTVLAHALKSPPLMSWLVSKGASIEGSPSEARGRTVAHWAAAGGHRLGLQYLFDQHKIDPSQADSEGSTLLHLACRSGDVPTVQLLLSEGADVNARNNDHRRPADLAGLSAGVSAALSAYAAARTDTARREAAKPDFSNRKNLMRREKVKLFLLAFFFPNLLLTAAGFLPAFFGIVALVGLSIGLQYITSRSIKSREPDPALAGWYIGGLTFGSFVLVSYGFPDFEYPNVKIAWYINTFLMFCFYVKAMMADPGTVRSTEEYRQAIYQSAIESTDRQGRMEFDLQTMVRKPCRSKFCTTSMKTVHRFDHYCVWTCNTIGAGNHRPFYFFCVCQLLSQLVVQWCATRHIFWVEWARYPEEAAAAARFDPCGWIDWLMLPSHKLILYFCFCYNFIVLMMIVAMVGQQTWYISRNITSNEVWYADRYPWCFKLGHRSHTVYNRGVCANWRQFLCGSLETHDASPPPVDSNPYLFRKVKAFTERQRRLGRPDVVLAKDDCCSHSHGSGDAQSHSHSHSHAAGSAPPAHSHSEQNAHPGAESNDPPEQLVQTGFAAPAPNAAAPAAGGSEGSRLEFYSDPDTGLMMPRAIQGQIRAMPIEQRRKMAERQREQFQRFGMLQPNGTVTMPPPEKEGALVAFMQTRLQQHQLGNTSVVPTQTAPVAAGDAAFSSAPPSEHRLESSGNNSSSQTRSRSGRGDQGGHRDY